MHFIVLLCKNANCKSATCNRVQLQNRLAGHSLLGDDISLRIGLVVGIFAIANLIVFFEFSYLINKIVEQKRQKTQ